MNCPDFHAYEETFVTFFLRSFNFSNQAAKIIHTHMRKRGLVNLKSRWWQFGLELSLRVSIGFFASHTVIHNFSYSNFCVNNPVLLAQTTERRIDPTVPYQLSVNTIND